MPAYKDDQNMVPSYAIEEVINSERTVESTIQEYEVFRMNEPAASESIEILVQSDVSRIAETNPEFFSQNKGLLRTIAFALRRSFLRGWGLGNSKWRSIVLLPKESRDKNPREYTPDIADFN